MQVRLPRVAEGHEKAWVFGALGMSTVAQP